MSTPSTTDRIIASALQLIFERGLGNVTMSDVANTAGISRQTLYNHFSDIDSIVAEAVSRHNAEGIRELRSAVAVVDHPADRITQLIRHIAQISTHQGHDLDFDHSLAPEHRGLFTDYTRALEGIIGEVLADGIEDGSFRPDLDPDLDAALVRHQLTGLSALVASDQHDTAILTRHATRTILAGLHHDKTTG